VSFTAVFWQTKSRAVKNKTVKRLTCRQNDVCEAKRVSHHKWGNWCEQQKIRSSWQLHNMLPLNKTLYTRKASRTVCPEWRIKKL